MLLSKTWLNINSSITSGSSFNRCWRRRLWLIATVVRRASLIFRLLFLLWYFQLTQPYFRLLQIFWKRIFSVHIFGFHFIAHSCASCDTEDCGEILAVRNSVGHECPDANDCRNCSKEDCDSICDPEPLRRVYVNIVNVSPCDSNSQWSESGRLVGSENG